MKISTLGALAGFSILPATMLAQAAPAPAPRPPQNPIPATTSAPQRDTAVVTHARNPISGTNSGTTNAGTSTGTDATTGDMSTDGGSVVSMSNRGAQARIISNSTGGLTRMQLLALQQELRDRKCGNLHVTGRLDAATRAAIRTCSRKLGVANNAAAVLAGFDIGFNSELSPSGNTRKDED